MNQFAGAPEGQHLLMLCSNEIIETGTMFDQYPEGYDHGVAERNCRLFADVVPREFPEATNMAARILVDIGLAQAIAQAYFCARSDLGRGRGHRESVRDAYVSISGLVKKWRCLFAHMDTGHDQDLAEIMRNIQLDGGEENEFGDFENVEE